MGEAATSKAYCEVDEAFVRLTDIISLLTGETPSPL